MKAPPMPICNNVFVYFNCKANAYIGQCIQGFDLSKQKQEIPGITPRGHHEETGSGLRDGHWTIINPYAFVGPIICPIAYIAVR